MREGGRAGLGAEFGGGSQGTTTRCGESFRWRRAEREGLRQRRAGTGDPASPSPRARQEQGQDPDKPGLCSDLGGLGAVVTGSPAGLGGGLTRRGQGIAVPLPFSTRKGRG